jgi:hypothetical protein
MGGGGGAESFETGSLFRFQLPSGRATMKPIQTAAIDVHEFTNEVLDFQLVPL